MPLILIRISYLSHEAREIYVNLYWESIKIWKKKEGDAKERSNR